MSDTFYDTRIEPSKRPRREYYAWSWRIQLDYHPQGERWDWMIETQNNGPVHWHRTVDEPSYTEIRQWIAAQEWSGDETRA